jgi:hypothetical protein
MRAGDHRSPLQEGVRVSLGEGFVAVVRRVWEPVFDVKVERIGMPSHTRRLSAFVFILLYFSLLYFTLLYFVYFGRRKSRFGRNVPPEMPFLLPEKAYLPPEWGAGKRYEGAVMYIYG